jgi:hypothetical protein
MRQCGDISKKLRNPQIDQGILNENPFLLSMNSQPWAFGK